MKQIQFKNLLLALVLLSTFATAGTMANEDETEDSRWTVNDCNSALECRKFASAYRNGVKQDYFKAVEFYRKSCDLNDGFSCVLLGFSYAEGEGVKQDDFKAVAFYQKACDLNDGIGCVNLGHAYEKGTVFYQDDFTAAEFYQRACDLNGSFVCNEMAVEGYKQAVFLLGMVH
jgi:TPR repeat protein